MEKRLPLALILVLAFVMWYLGQFAPPEGAEGLDGDSGPTAGTDAATPVGSPIGEPGQSSTSSTAPGPPGATPSGTTAGQALVSDAPDRRVRFDSADSQSEWQSLGASLAWMDLTDYVTSPEDGEHLPIMGAVDGDAGSFLMRDLNNRYGLDRIHWELEQRTNSEGSEQLVFTHRTQDGFLFERIITATDAESRPHSFELRINVTNEGSVRSDSLSLTLQSARGLVDEEAGSQFYGAPTALVVVGTPSADPEIKRWSGGDLTGDPRAIRDNEHVVAAGTMTNYFTSVAVPLPGTRIGTVYPVAILDTMKLARAVEAKNPGSEREREQWTAELASDHQTNAAADMQLWVPGLDPGQAQSFEFDVYNGPKDLDTAARPGFAFLKPVIEAAYGRWSWINAGLLQILRFFERVFGNWGLAIILLTVLVKGLLFPLNRKQQSSMMRYAAVMKKLKPQLDELKAKYKNNTKKYNEAQMKLLKAEGASPPLGGCLLMFLQFPIWISLFQILGTSIELRQSHFMFWINDLSRPDAMPFGLAGMETLNVLPVLMAIATTVQMRFAAAAGDPAQAQTQKIMGMVMPVFMLFFLYTYSSGLSLYIFISSLIGIFEFHVIRRVWPMDVAPKGTTPKPA
jgi:YidC/Oxa1 family membrane protein insertase